MTPFVENLFNAIANNTVTGAFCVLAIIALIDIYKDSKRESKENNQKIIDLYEKQLRSMEDREDATADVLRDLKSLLERVFDKVSERGK